MHSPCPALKLHLIDLQSAFVRGGEMNIDGISLPLLEIASTPNSLMASSFEEVYRRLERLDRAYLEPDGSFAWCGRGDSRRGDSNWKIEGMLYDNGQQVQRFEVTGGCPLEQWRELLACFGWPQQRLAAHITARGVFVDVQDLELLWSAAPEANRK